MRLSARTRLQRFTSLPDMPMSPSWRSSSAPGATMGFAENLFSRIHFRNASGVVPSLMAVRASALQSNWRPSAKSSPATFIAALPASARREEEREEGRRDEEEGTREVDSQPPATSYLIYCPP